MNRINDETLRVSKGFLTLLILLVTLACFGAANELPFSETFEFRAYGPLDQQNGWTVVPPEAAGVQSGITTGVSSLRACSLHAGSMSQGFASAPAAPRIVWLDLYVRSHTGESEGSVTEETSPSPFAESETTALVCIDGVTGSVMVYDGKDSLTLTNHPPLLPDTWARLTVRSDYTDHTWDLWLNGVNIARNLGFYNPEQTYLSELALTEHSSDESEVSFFDDIRMSLGWAGRPAGIPFLDDDGDGICDDWERHFFNSLTVASADGTDYDENGFSDRDEFLAGTDPMDSQSRLVISELVHLGEGRFEVSWQSAANRTYTLLYKTDIAQTAWTPLETGIPSTPPKNQRILEPGVSSGFYRIQVEPFE